MDLNIKINTSYKNFGIIEDISNYLNEDDSYYSYVNPPLKKSDSLSLTLVYLNEYNKESKYLLQSFTQAVPLEQDGWFTLYYIVLPTKQWCYTYPDLITIDHTYYIDDNKVYRYYENKNDEIISNPADLLNLLESPNISHNISYIQKDCVQTNSLRECYINFCKQIFNSKVLTSCDKSKIDSNLTYKRDLVWMGLNVIMYLTEGNKLSEAERIIELLHSCNGVCPNVKSNINNNYGCNCA